MQAEFDAHSNLKYVRLGLEQSFQKFFASTTGGLKGVNVTGQPRLHWTLSGIHPKFHKTQFSKFVVCLIIISTLSIQVSILYLFYCT